MKKTRYLFGLIPLAVSMALTAQPVTLQFRQTEYDIKNLQMIDSVYGFAVGEIHWDRDAMEYKSTILRTSSGGHTWLPQQTPATEDLWGVHFIDPDHGWVCGENGLLLYTVDGGSSWNRVDAGLNMDLKTVFFSDASTGWVAGNEVIHELFGEPDAWKSTVWHTPDGGSSWVKQVLPADAGLIHRLYFRNNMEGWALGVKNEQVEPFVETRCAAYHTEDAGETWIEKYSPDLPFIFTDMDFTDQDHGCLIGFATSSAENGGSIFMTSDGGENWQRTGEANVLWDVDFIDSLRGYAVGADYAAAWGPPVFRTMDGGLNWQKIRMEEHNSQGIYGLAVSEDQVIGLGDDGYMIRSVDPWGDYGEWNGEHLFNQILIDTLFQFEDVFFITPSKGWVVGQRSTGPQDWAQVIMHTDDGGKHWQEQYSFASDGLWSHTLRLNAVQFVNENRGWAVGYVEDVGLSQTSGILFTDDGGTTWSQQGEGITEGQLVDLYFIDDMTGWVLTDAASYPDGSAQLLKTTDAGDTWEMVNTGQDALITVGFAIRTGSLFFPDENTGWILGCRQNLLKTEDGGETWAKIPGPQRWINTFDIEFADNLHGTICGEDSVLFTTDGGMTWMNQTVTDRTLTALQFLDSVHGWMVGEYGLVYLTDDGGFTWKQVEHDATQAALKSVFFPAPETGWAVGRAGTIAQINPLIISAPAWPENAFHSFQLYHNQPNPLSDRTVIQFRIQEPANILLAVYDLQGRKVKVLAAGYRDQGRHHVIWDRTDDHGSFVSPGAYFYRLVTDEGSASRSMIVL
jgi:photosystem II stability/assembly factor-like uncharacterized protein